MSSAYRESAGDVCLFREVELRYAGPPVSGVPIQQSRHTDKLLREIIPDGPREVFVVIFLDTRNRPTGYVSFNGSLAATVVDPVDVFRSAILSCAKSVVLGHNHPSGQDRPSHEDVVMTERMKASGELLGIHVVDHVIISTESYFSFLDAGIF